MKILHCCLSNFYFDGFGYQENYLPQYNQKDGHDVKIIASTETLINSKLSYVKPSRYQTETGIPIVRIEYSKLFPHYLSKKIRVFPRLMEELSLFSPDVILFHGTGAYAVKVVANYVKRHPGVRLYVDNHGAYYNSAQNFVSKFILHKLLYRTWFRQALPFIDKVLYTGEGEKEYLVDMMNLREDEMEFYPLGGTIIDKREKQRRRREMFDRHNLPDDTVLFVHSGKLDPLKRTDSLLRAFSKVQDPRFRLFIIGSIEDDYRSALTPLIEADKRVQHLGWKAHEELLDYLCAADMYLQPGSVSATLQNAICCGTPVMIYPHKGYAPYVRGNGIRVKDEDETEAAFITISKTPEMLKEMSKVSYEMAREYLDYKKLAARLYV